MTDGVRYLEPGDGRRIAHVRLPGDQPEIVFLGGFRSDMTGTKAAFLEAHCRARGHAFTRFDYTGHGASSGRFEDGSIGDWLEDTLAVLDHVVQEHFLLVGSSMGGWLALLAGLSRPERLVGIVGIAAAPDFTARLTEPTLTAGQKLALERDGIAYQPSAYGDPLPITRRLLEDGRRHLLLEAPIPLACPVHLLQGQEDAEVPWRTALDLAARLESAAVTVELVKDGDHRLSRESDLRRLASAVDRVLGSAAGQAAVGEFPR
jgi:pimeloyl-ACP methyl ester carboxylesterase